MGSASAGSRGHVTLGSFTVTGASGSNAPHTVAKSPQRPARKMYRLRAGLAATNSSGDAEEAAADSCSRSEVGSRTEVNRDHLGRSWSGDGNVLTSAGWLARRPAVGGVNGTVGCAPNDSSPRENAVVVLQPAAAWVN